MSLLNTTINRSEKDQSMVANNDLENKQPFLSIFQLYQQKILRQIDTHSSMDMVYNYMVKKDIKPQQQVDQKQEKIRKSRKDQQGRKYICGACKLGYFSYPALYTHIKTKHNGETPQGTIKGENGKLKKRGRPKVRKNLQIYQQQLAKNDFPKQLTGLISRQSLETFELFDGIQNTQQQSEIMLKYFVGVIREMKKVKQTKIYILPITQIITVFLQNLKEFINQDTLKSFQQTFFDLIQFCNKRYEKILRQFQAVSNYYVNYTVNSEEKYCEVQRPNFLPIFIQKYILSELMAEDQLQQTILIDFCKWLFANQLTDIRISKSSAIQANIE